MGVQSAGARLNKKRIEELHMGLREMARALKISAAYLTDIEKNRRVPSEGLLEKICAAYSLDVAEMRAAWQRADSVVDEVANQDSITAKNVPQFLRTARNLTTEEWEKIIAHARALTEKRKGSKDG